MKNYVKGLLGLFLFLFLISLSPSETLAGGDEMGLLPSAERVDVDFKITSGLDINKEKESTFDKKRTISGTANEGTIITIDIHIQNKKDEQLQSNQYETESKDTENNEDNKDNNYYTIEVGASCIFSQTVELAIGENKIDITVEEEGKDKIEKNFIINRKSREIKQELEKAIVLPGETTETKVNEEESTNALDQLLKSNVER